MTSIVERDFVCPVCGENFRDPVVLSTNTFGGTESDFRPRAAGVDPLPFWIHTCPECLYTDCEFDSAVTGDVKRYVTGGEFRRGIPDSPKAFHKYELLARIEEFAGAGAREIAWSYLKAAWLAAEYAASEGPDSGDAEDVLVLERKYRKAAIDKLESSLGDRFQDDEEYMTVFYLVGELHRRLGEFDTAITYFERLEDDDRFKTLISQQKELASSGNAGPTMMP
jgi:uncharacterized protein (DUF2225 family)